MNRKNIGNEEWKKFGTKDRKPGPPVKFRLRPEDVLAQHNVVGTIGGHGGLRKTRRHGKALSDE